MYLGYRLIIRDYMVIIIKKRCEVKKRNFLRFGYGITASFFRRIQEGAAASLSEAGNPFHSRSLLRDI